MTPTDAAHATSPGSSLSLRAENALDGLMPANRMPRPSPTRPRTAAALAAASVSAVLLLACCAPAPNPVSAPASESFVDELEAPWSVSYTHLTLPTTPYV